MVTIKFWRFTDNVTVAEGVNLRQAFWALLDYYPNFLEKIAGFELDELDYAVECGYLTLEEDSNCDFIVDGEEGNTSCYSYTDEGVAELLFRAKDRNNYDYIISKF